MAQICTPVFSAACNPDQGWTTGPWFAEGIFGEPVPLKVSRFLIDAGVTARLVPSCGQEAFAFIIAGDGAAAASSPAGRFALATESMLWLGPCGELSFNAGENGLDLLVAEATGQPAGSSPEPARASGGSRGVAPPV